MCGRKEATIHPCRFPVIIIAIILIIIVVVIIVIAFVFEWYNRQERSDGIDGRGGIGFASSHGIVRIFQNHGEIAGTEHAMHGGNPQLSLFVVVVVV